MSGPVRRNADLTRARILDAAATEFARYGLGGARVGAIADRAKANKAMIYHYFGGKEDLYVAVLEECYRHIREQEAALEKLEAATAQRIVRRAAAYPGIIATSSEKGLGIDTLREAIVTAVT